MEAGQTPTLATDHRLNAVEYSKGIQSPFDEWHWAVPSPRAGNRDRQLELLYRFVELFRRGRGGWTSNHVTNLVQPVLDVPPQCRIRLITKLFPLVDTGPDADEIIRSVGQGSSQLPAFTTVPSRQAGENVHFICKNKTGLCIGSTGSSTLRRLSAHTTQSTFLSIALQAVVNIVIRRSAYAHVFGFYGRRHEWCNVESNRGNNRVRCRS